MRYWIVTSIFALVVSLGYCAPAPENEISESEIRGRRNMTEKAYIPGTWTRSAFEKAWQRWPNQTVKPDNYDLAFREHYGLHEAPFDNNGLPMGLKQTKSFLGRTIAIDCLVCHGGSIL